MKKRALSLLLVLLMVMSLVPMSALAVQNYQANEAKTGIDLYNKDGKLTYSARKRLVYPRLG